MIQPLLQAVNASGYRQFYLYFREGNLRFEEWQNMLPRLKGELRQLVRLFLVQQTLKETEAVRLLGRPLIKELSDAEVLMREGGKVRSNQFFLVCVKSLVFLCQINEDPWAYFGDDSLALAHYQTPQPGGRTLDLCAGPGIQTFISAQFAQNAVGVEIHPKACRIANLNRALNGMEKRTRFINASFEAYAESRPGPFDLITFNPPLVPIPDHLDYAFVGDGGQWGTLHAEKIMDLYTPFLAVEGRMEFVGMGVGNEKEPTFVKRMGKLARERGLHLRMHLLSRHRMKKDAPLFAGYSATLAGRNALDAGQLAGDLQQYYRKRGQNEFYLFFCSMQKTRKNTRPQRHLIDHSFFYYGDWFV